MISHGGSTPKFSVEGAKTESQVDQPAPLDMESPQIHGGPIKNHETSPRGQVTGQNCNDLTDHNQQAGEADLGQYCKKKKRPGPKRKVTKKPSQETEVAPDGPLISRNLNVEKETSENSVPITHTHATDAGQAWATQDSACLGNII